MGFVRAAEAPAWATWLAELRADGRVVVSDDRWFATEATREPKAVLRGRMEALGPVEANKARDFDPALMLALEADGAVLRARIQGSEVWCDRRLLARIQRYTLESLRREIEPVSAAMYVRFLAAWQHVDEDHRLDGPEGVRRVVGQLAGFEAPTVAWEKKLLASRVRDYRQEWLDQLALSGEVAWGRLFGSSRAALRSTPVALLPRAELPEWLGLAAAVSAEDLAWPAQRIADELQRRGALFPTDLASTTELLPSDAERGLEELISRGLLTSDSFASLRQLLRPSYRRRAPVRSAGRWSLFRERTFEAPDPEFAARALLRRWGVVFRRLLDRERLPVLWRDLARALRTLELRGEIRGGRFVAGFSGEQFALPEAVPLLRKTRRDDSHAPLSVAASDPLNLSGILTPDDRIPATALRSVEVLGTDPA